MTNKNEFYWIKNSIQIKFIPLHYIIDLIREFSSKLYYWSETLSGKPKGIFSSNKDKKCTYTQVVANIKQIFASCEKQKQKCSF